MKFVLVLLILAVGGAGGFALSKLGQPQIRPFGRLSFADKIANDSLPFLSAQGSWAGHASVGKTNQVKVECEPKVRTCTVNLAEIKTLPQTDHPYLFLAQTNFVITHLDAIALTAVSQERSSCFRETLLIDRTAHSISLVRTIDEGAGCSDWKDDARTLTLVDGWKASFRN